MRRLVLLFALCLLVPTAAVAENAPANSKLPAPASLIGKALDVDRQSALGSDAPRATAGVWSYGFEYDDPGLMRTASSKDRSSGGSVLSTAFRYDQRCARSDRAAPFAFSGDERFVLKGTVAKGRWADAWIYYGDAATFQRAPVKIAMAFSENDGALHFKLDPARMTQVARLALCPSAGAASAARCAIFSLAGFARAYDFVCDAK